MIRRDPGTPARWWHGEEVPRGHLAALATAVQVVLTIAHLCQDSTCDDLTHLRALCQRCHLIYDATQHQRNAAATRRQRLEAQGQLRLWAPEQP
jgi:hypothetical protein